MGSQDTTAGGRRLRLTRETLRDLAPSTTDAAAVRGGDTSTCGRREFCFPFAGGVESLLGQTMISWGCTGSIRLTEHDGGFEIVFDLHPNQEMLDLQDKFLGKG